MEKQTKECLACGSLLGESEQLLCTACVNYNRSVTVEVEKPLTFEWDLTEDDLDNSYEDEEAEREELFDNELEEAKSLLEKTLIILNMEFISDDMGLYDEIKKFLGDE